MQQRISLITLGVTDLDRARSFYERLGWRGREVQETVFFRAGGAVLTLWSRGKLGRGLRIVDALPDQPAFGGIVLAHNVATPDEVDAILTDVSAAGGRVTRPAGPTFYGGYAGCFADPDGHIWEVAHNPGFALAADGSVVLPDSLLP